MTIADMESIADGKETSKWSMPKLKANFILVPMKDWKQKIALLYLQMPIRNYLLLEELPHVRGQGRWLREQESLEELSHVEGQEGQQ